MDVEEPKSSLKEVVEFLKAPFPEEMGLTNPQLPLGEIKELSIEDKLELRLSLDKVKGI